MKKSLKKDPEKNERKGEISRSLALRRETILTLSDPLLGLALGRDGGIPTESYTSLTPS